MPNEQNLVFETDPDRFREIVLNSDSNARFDALGSLDDQLLCEVVRYGVYNREEMIGPLRAFYRGPGMELPEERRFTVYRHVAGFVEHSSVSTDAFLPFIADDDSRNIVATAVLNYISLGPLTNGDQMSRVKDIIGMIENGTLRNEGAAFGALLHSGHRRVCDLLVPLRDSLDREAMSNAVKCGTGFIHSSTIDFYLDWLEGMEGSDQDGAFGTVASGLGLLKKTSQHGQVCTGNRPFPARSLTNEQWVTMLKPIALAEYVRKIAPRMYALERAEPPPRVMPHVLAEWGLKPLTDPPETAVLDDRAATTTGYLGPQLIPGGRVVDVKSEWWDGEGHIFLAWGILNPNGPTLYVLGSREFDGKHRMFMRWLHMFGGCTTYAADVVNEITYQRVYEDVVSVHEHLVRNQENGLFHVIPSFLITSGGDEVLGDIAKRLLSSGAAAHNDWGRHIAYTRQFGSNFFARAGAEIRETYEMLIAEARSRGEEPSDFLKWAKIRYGDIPDFREANIPSWTETAMTPELLEEWWRIVSPREFQVAAILALKTMWEGAPKVLSEEAQAKVVPWDPVMRFLDDYGLSLPNT